MKNILFYLSILIMSLSLTFCKVDKKAKNDNNSPTNNRGDEPRIPDTACENLFPGTFIQAQNIDTIYYFTMSDDEVQTLKPFPNWYSYKSHIDALDASGLPLPVKVTVADSCITSILANVPLTVKLDSPYPNTAKIKINFALNDSGIVYINGNAVSSGTPKELKTGQFAAPYAPGKNIIEIQTTNASGFGGAIANINVNDCGEIGPDGKCDGSGYNFRTQKPYPINYTIPGELKSTCFPLYAVNFNGSSFWGLSKTEPDGWNTKTTMSGFNYIPEGYTQNNSEVGTGSLPGFTSPMWISSGVDHDYCGPEGYDWGTFDAEDGNLYFKTIITCDYYYCNQIDAVQKTLWVP